MDWCLEADDPRAFRALREELFAYLERHSVDGSNLFDSKVIFDELVGNAIRHAGGSIWVSVDWTEEKPTLIVNDLGPGFVPETSLPDDILSEGGRGLFLVSSFASHLDVAAKTAGGTRVAAQLPLSRPAQRSIDPPPKVGGSLPAPEEANEDGTFGKESFLRALVVQLAQNVEVEQGPAAAEAAVAAVGTDVGGRMEEEYRRARKIASRLSPDQMADLYVRLKHAIDGDFYVIESTPEKIVLGNRRCPFGDAVKKAPTLCRMTSSVFGGIAARNSGNAAVALEERIAVGDHECRVTVYLGEAADDAGSFVHHYGDQKPATA